MILSKENFVNAINALKEQDEINEQFAHSMGKIFPNAFEADLLPPNTTVVAGLEKLLKVLMNDEYDWIQYFIYELDFGKENHRLKVYEKDGTEIPLETPENLYNLLITSKNVE